MGEKSAIEWTDATWNPWHGCVKVSQGCKNCYMYRDKLRYGQDPASVVRSKTTFDAPLRWHYSRKIFACSWSDWFLDLADQWRDEAWDIIRRTPYHIYQVLTKRPERILSHLPKDWSRGWKNVWLGVSIEDQAHTYRLELLQAIPASIRFVSAEPLLEPLDLGDLTGINWVITGGESGPGARAMKPEWALTIRDQCIKNKVQFFHKQNGGTRKVNGAWGGRSLGGKTWNGMPETWDVSSSEHN